MLSPLLTVPLLLICSYFLRLFYRLYSHLDRTLSLLFKEYQQRNHNLENLLKLEYRYLFVNLDYRYLVIQVECCYFDRNHLSWYFFFAFLTYFVFFQLPLIAMWSTLFQDLMSFIQNHPCFISFPDKQAHFQWKYAYVNFPYSYIKIIEQKQLQIQIYQQPNTHIQYQGISINFFQLQPIIYISRVFNHSKMIIFLGKNKQNIMRYSLSIFREAVSQWRDCYIHYEYLKLFIVAIQRIMEEVNQLQDKVQQNQKIQNQQQKLLTVDQVIFINDTLTNLKVIIVGIDQLYIRAFLAQVHMCKMFCVFKFNQIQRRYKLAHTYYGESDIIRKQKVLKPYTQYIYIQAVYLTKMIQSNQQAQRKILKKLKKYGQGVAGVHEPQLLPFLTPYSKKMGKIIDEIQNFYVELCLKIDQQKKRKKQKPKIKRDYLRKIAQNQLTTNSDSFVFGLWVGVFVAVLIFMSLLLVYKNKSVQTDPIFNRDFSTWRGIAFLIFYIWIIGLNVYYFQHYKVSHDIILDYNEHHYLHSIQIFKIAGVFSTIFSALFTIYALNLSGIVDLFNFSSKYLVIFIWGILILFLLNPFPTKFHKSRFFILKTLCKLAISPCVGVPFLIAWSTDQLLSLITPFEDLTYTICYYTALDFTDIEVKHNACKSPATIAVFVYSTIIFLYRMLQCIRQGYDKGKYWRQFQFYNTLKYLTSLITLILSFLWKSGNQKIFAAWLTFTIVSTFYSYVWDLKVDWNLLQRNVDHCLLRKTITYPSYIYYIIMVGNLVLRLAWTLTLSQNIVSKTFGSPEIFRLVTGALEIFRRGMWNLLRIQKQHIKNCQQFTAIHKIYGKLQLKIVDDMKNMEIRGKNQSAQRLQAPLELQIIQSNVQIIEHHPQINNDMMPTLKNLQQQVLQNQATQKQLLSELKIKQERTKNLIKQIKTSKQIH